MKNLLNLEWSDTWKNKTCIISRETFRIVINLSKAFLQIQSIFIISNQKQMIFIWRKPWSSEKKLLIFKISSKLSPKTQKLYQITCIFWNPVIFFHSSPLYQLIATNRNHWIAVNLQTPTIYPNKSTLLHTLKLCYKALGIFQREIKK